MLPFARVPCNRFPVYREGIYLVPGAFPLSLSLLLPRMFGLMRRGPLLLQTNRNLLFLQSNVQSRIAALYFSRQRGSVEKDRAFLSPTAEVSCCVSCPRSKYGCLELSLGKRFGRPCVCCLPSRLVCNIQ